MIFYFIEILSFYCYNCVGGFGLAREKLLFERKSFGFRLDADLVKRLKIVAVNQDKAVNVLIEEAIELLLQKYNK